MVSAYLIRIKDVKVDCGYVVYDEEVTGELIFNLDDNKAINKIFKEYGEYIDDINLSNLLLYLCKEGLDAFIEDIGLSSLSDEDNAIVHRIQAEIDASPMDIVCMEVY